MGGTTKQKAAAFKKWYAKHGAARRERYKAERLAARPKPTLTSSKGHEFGPDLLCACGKHWDNREEKCNA